MAPLFSKDLPQETKEKKNQGNILGLLKKIAWD